MKPTERLTSYSIHPERIAFTLLIILATLVLLHVLAMQANFNPALGLKDKYGFHYWQLAFFDLDEEESFGTWFNSGLLMISAMLLLHRARILRAHGEAGSSWCLGSGFAFCRSTRLQACTSG